MEDKLYQTVVEYIKEEIKEDRLRVGDRLPAERELSARLGLGRTSIREALRTMSSLGMIESRQGSGNYLTGDISKFFTDSFDLLTLINKTRPQEIIEMRRALEIEALRQLILSITPPQLNELQDIAYRIDDMDQMERSELDLHFHQKIIEFCGNSLMLMTCRALSTVFLTNLDKNLRSMSEEGRLATHRCHHMLVDALRRRNFAAGIKAIAEHYDLVEETVRSENQDQKDPWGLS